MPQPLYEFNRDAKPDIEEWVYDSYEIIFYNPLSPKMVLGSGKPSDVIKGIDMANVKFVIGVKDNKAYLLNPAEDIN